MALAVMVLQLFLRELFVHVVVLLHPWDHSTEEDVLAVGSKLQGVGQDVLWSDDDLTILIAVVLLFVIEFSLVLVGGFNSLLHNLGWNELLVVASLDMTIRIRRPSHHLFGRILKQVPSAVIRRLAKQDLVNVTFLGR